MTRTELTPVEHGLAVLVAFGLATVGQVAVVASVTPGAAVSRSVLAWCLSDAIPTAVVLALLASRPPVTVVRALGAAVLVEVLAVGACLGLTAFEVWQQQTQAGVRGVLDEVIEGLYGGRALGLLGALGGRTLALLLAARARGTILGGLALGAPLAVGWSCTLMVQRGFRPTALVGPATFAWCLTVLLPIAERGVVAAFRALGITEDEGTAPRG